MVGFDGYELSGRASLNHSSMSEKAGHLGILFGRNLAAAILHDVDLCSPGGLVAPHFPHLLNAASMMAGASMLWTKDGEKGVQPFVDLLEFSPEFPLTICTVFLERGHRFLTISLRR